MITWVDYKKVLQIIFREFGETPSFFTDLKGAVPR